MRTIFICGNWKMNTSLADAKQLIDGIYEKIELGKRIDIAVCPPSPYIYPVLNCVNENEKKKNIALKVGAQNMYFEEKGAFTGEISAHMLQDVGCSYVILGHSERRTIFGETSANVSKKAKKALSLGMLPIVCIGETLEEREKGIEQEVVAKQLSESLESLSPSQVETCTIAYEPVWAIGTGKTASPDIAQNMHSFIREHLKKLYGETVANSIRIQYGGSVKPGNIKELISQQDIDGALIGGASLKAEAFAEIVNVCSSFQE